ncbi:MAG: ATP-binding cassette domain-containing protein [Pseudomonadota bacterium]
MLEGRNITVRYGSKVALEAVSCVAAPGEVVAVIGPNGAGKSTLLSALSGISQPASGTVTIDATCLTDLNPQELALRRAVLEQTPVKDLPYTAEMLVGLTIPTAVPPKETSEIVARALHSVDLVDARDVAVHQLSGGQAHRAHLARALAQLWAGRYLGYGRYLLIDEPTASLDLQHQRSVLEVTRQVRSDGAGVLIVLHDLTLAAAIADRVIIIASGRLAADGPPRDVLRAEVIGPIYQTPILVIEQGSQHIVAPDYRPGSQTLPSQI